MLFVLCFFLRIASTDSPGRLPGLSPKYENLSYLRRLAVEQRYTTVRYKRAEISKHNSERVDNYSKKKS